MPVGLFRSTNLGEFFQLSIIVQNTYAQCFDNFC